MRHSTRFRLTLPAAVIAAGVIMQTIPVAAAPAAVVATVNGERITVSDLERVLRSAQAGTSRSQALDDLVAEALIVQDARRRKLDESFEYHRLLRRWRENKAVGLIGVDELRLIAGHGRPAPYAEFYPRAAAAYAALADAERAQLEEAVERRVAALREQARIPVDVATLRRYTTLGKVPAENARGVIAAEASWGRITLQDILAEEPGTLAHVAQTAADILKTWQQIAGELSARARVAAAAGEEKFFAVREVREEEEVVKRALLRQVSVEAYVAGRLTDEVVRERVDSEIGTWAASFGLTAEEALLAKSTRLEAEQAFEAWRDSGTRPGGVKGAPVPLDKVWDRLTPDQKRVLMAQPWKGFVPPILAGAGYLLLRLEAVAPPPESPTLRSYAESLLWYGLQREFVANLSRGASITRQERP